MNNGSDTQYTQAYLEATHRLHVFVFGVREFQTDDPENAKLFL